MARIYACLLADKAWQDLEREKQSSPDYFENSSEYHESRSKIRISKTAIKLKHASLLLARMMIKFYSLCKTSLSNNRSHWKGGRISRAS